MKYSRIFAAALSLLGITQPASAAEMTLIRNSRLVTAAEIDGGAPQGGMVHDFYATSDADLLTLATHFDQWTYQHPYGSDNDAPPSELITHFPALAADSFLRMPSSTMMLGGGFNGADSEKVWGDLSNDGPQSDFLFGRMTTTEPGAFAGYFAVRGQETYIKMPFSFTLPGPSGAFTETLSISGIEQSPIPYAPPETSLPNGEETTAPEPRHMKPSRVAQLTSWMVNLPPLPPPPTAEILAFKESLLAFKGSLQPSMPQPRMVSGELAAIPEPASWALIIVGVPLLLRRMAIRTS